MLSILNHTSPKYLKVIEEIKALIRMSKEDKILEEIKSCFVNLLGIDKIKGLVNKALNNEINPLSVINAMKDGLDEVGKRYEEGKYFLSDLIMAGIMATELTNMLKPHLTEAYAKQIGKVVIGTVKGDIHDIGKNLVASMLSSQGFEVVDIGVDVPPERFIDSIKQYKPDILAMSCLLTIGMPEMQKTIELIKQNNLDVKTMVGGRPITQEFANEIGADGYGKDAFEAMHVARRLIGEKNE